MNDRLEPHVARAMLGGGLFLFGLVILLVLPEQVLAQPRPGFPMPNVIGLTVSQAEEAVLAAGQTYRATSAKAVVVGSSTDERPEGQIIRQLESRGTLMRPYMDDVGGTYGEVTFRVVVSTGPPAPTTFSMPDVVGMTVEEAERTVRRAGQQTGTTSARANVVRTRSHSRPEGQIIRQLEPVGTAMRPYSDDVGGIYGEVTFRVVVSTGPELAPDFVGRYLDSASQLANQREVELIVGASRRNPQIDEGIVVEQDPAAGEPMRQRRVTVYPSAGFPLPDYVSRPVERARRGAENLGFELEEEPLDSLDVPFGDIVDQDPGAGTLLPLEEPVTVIVSNGWPVPDFIARTESEAADISGEFNIELNVSRQDNFEVPAGIIFDQQPPAGDRLPRDRTVNVLISNGFPLPDLVGLPAEQAFELAGELSFDMSVGREPLRDRVAGQVDRQSPEPGTLLPLDEPVIIVVSDGWPTPNFLTLGENDANALANQRDVILEVSARRQDRNNQPGIVIDQEPRPDTLLAPGQAVGVVLSAGYPTPRLVGLVEAEADSVAEGEDIDLVKESEPSLDFARGLVFDQRPDPGSPLPPDDEVTIFISTGWPTPDFVGKSEEQAERMARDNSITLIQEAPREDFDMPAGLVVAQQPQAEAIIPADRRVRISLSLGWPVAPDAVGRSFDSVRQEFLIRHPDANVERDETLLTIEPAGTVVSQRPEPNDKLDRQQRLVLVAAGTKPVWLWPVVGVFAIAIALGGFAALKALTSSSTQQEIVQAHDPGGVRMRVVKDHGVQTTDIKGETDTADAEIGEIVKVRVEVDLGEQSISPIDDKGDQT